MFLLGEKIGKQKAHRLLYEISMKARNVGRPLMELLMEVPEICDHFSREMLETILTPARHIGLAARLTDRVLKSAEKWIDCGNRFPDEEMQCPLMGKNGGCNAAG